MKTRITLIMVLCFFTFGLIGQNQTAVLTKIERSTKSSNNIADYFDANLAPFYHGVASGDPLEDAVIIWTRVTSNVNAITVNWKVATNPQMTQVVKQGQLITNQSKDYTVKVDVTGLDPYTTYYYQFEALGRKSIVGKTRTTPSQDQMVDNLRFAVVSCSNYQSGYFNTYNQIAGRNDLDAVIHLGDYIYEYHSGGYGYSSSLGRGHLPKHEIVTLSDYRVRYSYYRLDPMLRNVHQQHPFINIWDDHEFANDANKYGAQNHQSATEGSWEVRKANAHKAYFEWMPIRANNMEEYRLYRKFSYGKLMDLMMLDTRIEGRNTQSNRAKDDIMSAAVTNDVFKSYVTNVIAKKDLANKTELKEVLRTVMPMLINVNTKNDSRTKGLTPDEFETVLEQFTALVLNENQRSKVAVDELRTLLEKGAKDEVVAETKASYNSILGATQFDWLTQELRSSQAKWRIIGNQVMMMKLRGVPAKDGWEGYKQERDRLLKYIKDYHINNVVVLTGDIHTTWVGEVQYNGNCEACEFIVPSVTSTNVDVVGPLAPFASSIGQWWIKLWNRHVEDIDLDNHGYYVLDVRENRVQADWYDVNEIKRPVNGESRSRGWYIKDNKCGLYKAWSAARVMGDKGETVINAPFNKSQLQEKVLLMGVYPSPMDLEGNVHYVVNEETEVNIALYDTRGRQVQQLQNKVVPMGIYNLSFNVSDLKAGAYIVVIKTGEARITRRIIVK